MAIYSECSHEKWWFSIVMLVYQRVKWNKRMIFSGTQKNGWSDTVDGWEILQLVDGLTIPVYDPTQ